MKITKVYYSPCSPYKFTSRWWWVDISTKWKTVNYSNKITNCLSADTLLFILHEMADNRVKIIPSL